MSIESRLSPLNEAHMPPSSAVCWTPFSAAHAAIWTAPFWPGSTAGTGRSRPAPGGLLPLRHAPGVAADRAGDPVHRCLVAVPGGVQIHEPIAREAGVAEAVIEALREGREPTFERDDEALVVRWVSRSIPAAASTRRSTPRPWRSSASRRWSSWWAYSATTPGGHDAQRLQSALRRWPAAVCRAAWLVTPRGMPFLH